MQLLGILLFSEITEWLYTAWSIIMYPCSWSQKLTKIQEILLKITTGNSIDVTDMWHAEYLQVYLDSSAKNGKPGEVEFCLSFEDC